MAKLHTRDRQFRSLRTSRRFHVAVFFTLLHFFGIAVTVTALVTVLMNRSGLGLQVTLGALGFSIVSWLVAFIQRKSAFCPLCKGTPLVNNGAIPHSTAKRIPLASHGVTAVLSIIACHKFRCMYCGTDFDLLKTPPR